MQKDKKCTHGNTNKRLDILTAQLLFNCINNVSNSYIKPYSVADISIKICMDQCEYNAETIKKALTENEHIISGAQCKLLEDRRAAVESLCFQSGGKV